MIIAQILGFEGRQRRLYFWIVAIVIGVISTVVFQLTAGAIYATFAVTGSYGGVFRGAAMLGLLICLALLWLSLANSVKRCHDRDKSGWWLVLMWLASFTGIGALWPLIELGFLDGTPGPNRFGPSPKGLDTAPATT